MLRIQKESDSEMQKSAKTDVYISLTNNRNQQREAGSSIVNRTDKISTAEAGSLTSNTSKVGGVATPTWNWNVAVDHFFVKLTATSTNLIQATKPSHPQPCSHASPTPMQSTFLRT